MSGMCIHNFQALDMALDVEIMICLSISISMFIY